MEKPVKTTRKKRKPEAPDFAPARVVYIPNAVDNDGEPRVALEVPPRPGSMSRRPTLLMFASMAAALASKQRMEGGTL
jgi:hypothetical protein